MNCDGGFTFVILVPVYFVCVCVCVCVYYGGFTCVILVPAQSYITHCACVCVLVREAEKRALRVKQSLCCEATALGSQKAIFEEKTGRAMAHVRRLTWLRKKSKARS